jgi:hypothetical protein
MFGGTFYRYSESCSLYSLFLVVLFYWLLHFIVLSVNMSIFPLLLIYRWSVGTHPIRHTWGQFAWAFPLLVPLMWSAVCNAVAKGEGGVPEVHSILMGIHLKYTWNIHIYLTDTICSCASAYLRIYTLLFMPISNHSYIEVPVCFHRMGIELNVAFRLESVKVFVCFGGGRGILYIVQIIDLHLQMYIYIICGWTCTCLFQSHACPVLPAFLHPLGDEENQKKQRAKRWNCPGGWQSERTKSPRSGFKAFRYNQTLQCKIDHLWIISL